MKEGSVTLFKPEVHSCILFERAARGSFYQSNAFIQHGRFDLLLDNSR